MMSFLLPLFYVFLFVDCISVFAVYPCAGSVIGPMALVSVSKKLRAVLCFLLGNSPASEFYMPTFRNTLFHLQRQVGMKKVLPAYGDRTDRVPKRRHIKFRRRGITQKKVYSIQNMAKV